MKKSLKLRVALNIWKYPLYSLALRAGGDALIVALLKDAERLLKYDCGKDF